MCVHVCARASALMPNQFVFSSFGTRFTADRDDIFYFCPILVALCRMICTYNQEKTSRMRACKRYIML